ncbi:hypothetical protein [Cryptosporangium sp. NPDC048952]|uniref:hypothetical protein n=1 Tax=Cryptosporangium sp. NPDC048952 TaxID=3363961 RepID=UPI003714F3D8
MGEFADRLAGLHVRAALPDDSLAVELVGRDEVTLRIQQYERLTSPDLERRLAQLARLLCARHTAEYFRIRSDVTEQTLTHESPALGRQEREFRAARDELIARGRSADGRIAVETRGMREWTVRIRPDTLRTLSEAEFVAAVREAAAELIADQRDQIRDIAVRTYR